MLIFLQKRKRLNSPFLYLCATLWYVTSSQELSIEIEIVHSVRVAEKVVKISFGTSCTRHLPLLNTFL